MTLDPDAGIITPLLHNAFVYPKTEPTFRYLLPSSLLSGCLLAAGWPGRRSRCRASPCTKDSARASTRANGDRFPLDALEVRKDTLI